MEGSEFTFLVIIIITSQAAPTVFINIFLSSRFENAVTLSDGARKDHEQSSIYVWLFPLLTLASARNEADLEKGIANSLPEPLRSFSLLPPSLFPGAEFSRQFLILRLNPP